MKTVTLHIETRDQIRDFQLEDEVSIGRTDAAGIALDDVGLSRVNTTFFRDGEMVLVVDEKSLNGTFLNGERVGKRPLRVIDGDQIRIGGETVITVKIEGEKKAEKSVQKVEPEPVEKAVPTKPKKSAPQKTPLVLVVAAVSTFAIVTLAGLTILLVQLNKPDDPGGKSTPPRVSSTKKIPIRVIDPLGGGDPDDIDDLMTYWDVQEEELNTDDVAAITPDKGEPDTVNLNVPIDFFKRQMAKSKEQRRGPVGLDPPGTLVPPELRNAITKQINKINDMKSRGYKIPMDFADLAEKRFEGKLVELPMATEDYVLDVGGSSTTGEFTHGEFAGNSFKSTQIVPSSVDYNILQRMAGEKYSLDTPDDRRQIKIRLLRMFHPSAKPILDRLAKSYREKFGYPLRVTSLSRSMEYQISLNRGNPNSYVVRNANAVPPHTSGCTFDLSRKFMTADEQNYLMFSLAELEKQGIVDALREGNVNACFHVFILGGCDI